MRPLILLPFMLAFSVAYADDPPALIEETVNTPEPSWQTVSNDQGITATYIQNGDLTLGAQCTDGDLRAAVLVQGAILRTDSFVIRIDDNEAQEFSAGGPDPGRLFVTDIDRFLDELSSATTSIRVVIANAWSFGISQLVTVDVTLPPAAVEDLDRVRVACGRVPFQKEIEFVPPGNPVLTDLFGR